MYYLRKIKAKNFQSFKDLDHDFTTGKTLIVNGENLTDEGQENNGSGKSTLQEIVYYSLLGSSSTGKRDCKLIRWGEETASIELHLYNSISRKTLIIKRNLYLKKSSSLKLIELDDRSQEISLSDKFSSVNEGNKLILEMIDISSEDLKNFFLINGEKFTSFFSSSDTKKRDLIGRFSSADKLLSINDVFDSKSKDLLIKKKDLETRYTIISSKIDVYRQELNSIEQESSNNSICVQIEEKHAKIEELKSTIFIIKQSEQSLIEDIKSFEESLERDKFLYGIYDKYRRTLRRLSYNDKIQDAQQEINTYLVSGNKIQLEKEEKVKELYDYKEIFNKMQLNLKSSISCPKCSHQFVLNKKDVDIDEIKQLIDPTKELIGELEIEIQSLDKKIKSLTSQTNPQYQELLYSKNRWMQMEEKRSRMINSATSQLTQISKTIEYKEEEIGKFTIKRNKNKSSVENYKSIIESIEKEIEALEKNGISVENEKRIESITTKLEELISDQESLQKELESIENVIRDVNKWEQYFKQFYTYLTNKSLKSIEDLCNNFLSKIKTDLQIKFEGFKVLANGSIKEDITAKIFRDGIEEEDYRCFSGGEKGRLIFSTILAFQHLINSKSKSGGLDFLFVDEILDKVDSLGMYNFTKSLEVTGKTIFLTSQVRIKEDNSNTLTIVKENGISRIK